MPLKSSTRLTHCFWLDFEQVGRAGRFGTKGLAITFVSCSTDVDVLNNVGNFFRQFLFNVMYVCVYYIYISPLDF